jgi:hypothetical protein
MALSPGTKLELDTIHPNAALAGTDFQGLDLRVHIHGPQIYSGFIGLSGKSWARVPSYAASVNRRTATSAPGSALRTASPLPRPFPAD